MLNPYDMSVLRSKLNAGDPVDSSRAIYTLARHIETLEKRLAELELQIAELSSGKADRD
jgi:hypothetical protein